MADMLVDVAGTILVVDIVQVEGIAQAIDIVRAKHIILVANIISLVELERNHQ